MIRRGFLSLFSLLPVFSSPKPSTQALDVPKNSTALEVEGGNSYLLFVDARTIDVESLARTRLEVQAEIAIIPVVPINGESVASMVVIARDSAMMRAVAEKLQQE